MSFDFYGADLDTAEGQEAYLAMYAELMGAGPHGIDTATQIYEENGAYTEWTSSNPSESANFLNSLAQNESPALRRLAGRIATDWVFNQPDVATEVMIKCASDSEPEVRESIGYINDFLRSEVWDDEFGALGLMRLHNIIKTIKSSQESA